MRQERAETCWQSFQGPFGFQGALRGLQGALSLPFNWASETTENTVWRRETGMGRREEAGTRSCSLCAPVSSAASGSGCWKHSEGAGRALTGLEVLSRGWKHSHGDGSTLTGMDVLSPWELSPLRAVMREPCLEQTTCFLGSRMSWACRGWSPWELLSVCAVHCSGVHTDRFWVKEDAGGCSLLLTAQQTAGAPEQA